MVLFTVGVGDCELAINHDDFLILLEELKVAFLKFDT